MRYPALENHAVIRRDRHGGYRLIDQLFDEQYRVSPRMADWLQHLDGRTDPYQIDATLPRHIVSMLLLKLDRELLLRHSRVIRREGGAICVTLFRIHDTRAKRMLGYIANALIMLLWFPVLLFGMSRLAEQLYLLDTERYLLGWLAGAISGLFLHECAHTAAALGYGGYVFEMGVMLRYLLPGAYVLMNTNHIKNRLRRVQIHLAGIEMNLLLSGVYFLLAAAMPGWIGFFFTAGITNMLLAAINLLLSGGLDGRHAIDELLGSCGALSYFIDALFDRNKRMGMRRQGVFGYAKLACGGILALMHLTLPILVAANILEAFL